MRFLLVTLLGLVAFVSCQKGEPARGPRVNLTPCREPGIDPEVVCGTLEVYEDRAARTGRKVPLKIVVARALAPTAAPDPLFVLAGGPGQAATEIAGRVIRTFERVRRHRDVVFVDQRGTGSSKPLDCDLANPDAGLAEQLADKLTPDHFKTCLAGYDADPRLYTTAIAMDDLDEVRDALGYKQLNLWGGSYGTRAALVYLRQHAAKVRTITLDGVAPVDLRLPVSFAKDGQRAMDLLLDHCEKDASCARAFPQLRNQFRELLGRLAKTPAKVRVDDPVSGVPTEVTITRDAFTSILRGLLYLPEAASLLPLFISRAAADDYGPFVAAASMLNGGFQKGMSLGMFFSVICAEDAPLVKREEIPLETANTFMGPQNATDLMDICDAWPRGFVPEGYHQAVQSDLPVLILSGELDPVTPPAYGDQVARTLPRSRHLVVPGVGHGVSGQGCLPRVVADFIASGTTEGLDAECVKVLKRPPFFVTFAGPTR